ncbi:thiamine pyrophosphate-binding protein [Streptomyces sp. NPDC058830]|uniref:thiamine pyrophosphate-binding protein n=2 Tax=Streptomyces TaxID=1883 RepID=UPI0036AC8819
MWESLARRHRDGEPAPTYLDLTHETVAVGMATGYGLVERRPQGVLLHAAPGLLQGSMAVHGALLAGVPMVVTSSESTTYGDGPGQDPGGQWYRNLSIVGGPHHVAQPFTKWANEASHISTLPTMITRAAELAWRAPPTSTSRWRSCWRTGTAVRPSPLSSRAPCTPRPRRSNRSRR